MPLARSRMVPVQRIAWPRPKPSSVTIATPIRTGRGAKLAEHAVVVVGAGPVGLSLAIDLAQRGQPVVLLDDADRIGEGSRAICFSKRSLEYWDRLGVGQRMVDKGVVWSVGKIFHGDPALRRDFRAFARRCAQRQGLETAPALFALALRSAYGRAGKYVTIQIGNAITLTRTNVMVRDPLGV